MQIVFKQDYLSVMYITGKSDKSPWFQPEVVKKYVKIINILKHAKSIEDLFPLNSLNYEKLKGDKSGLESVRVTGKYRLEIKTEVVQGETIATICNVIELTNHYQ